MDDSSDQPDRRTFMRALYNRHPPLRESLVGDARMNAIHRGERHEFRSRLDVGLQILRLAWASDAFRAQILYRLKTAMQATGIPVMPRLAHHLAMATAQVTIGDPVLIAPGLYIIHGQVVLDGLVEIGPGAVIGPFVTIGLRAGNVQGPTIGKDVNIGTGAKVIGDVRIGDGATIGANAVVVSDVPPGATVVGSPARPSSSKRSSAR